MSGTGRGRGRGRGVFRADDDAAVAAAKPGGGAGDTVRIHLHSQCIHTAQFRLDKVPNSKNITVNNPMDIHIRIGSRIGIGSDIVNVPLY